MSASKRERNAVAESRQHASCLSVDMFAFCFFRCQSAALVQTDCCVYGAEDLPLFQTKEFLNALNVLHVQHASGQEL